VAEKVGWKTHFFCLVMSRLTEIVKNSLLPEMVLLNIVENSKGNLVRIIVDGERPVTISETTQLIHNIRSSDEMMLQYPHGIRIEVTTPGIDKSLTEPFQYRKNRNRILDIVFEDNNSMNTTIRGRVISADDGSVTLGLDKKEITLNYDQIKTAKVKLEFN